MAMMRECARPECQADMQTMSSGFGRKGARHGSLSGAVYAGLPSVAANATSALAMFPGYLAGAAGFWPELQVVD